MSVVGPFEARPVIAVAVSGGADSMALALLSAHWCRQRGGSAVALMVDHQLRAESAAEAQQVGRWLALHGIAHHVVTWTGPKPTAGIQAAARTARYRLLREKCQELGVLHLTVGHTQDDQVETHLMRRSRGQGLGLAAMAASQNHAGIHLLRPLLNSRHAALCDWLRARSVQWLEDPSNTSLDFERVRIRQMLTQNHAARETAQAHIAQWSYQRHHYQEQTAGDIAVTAVVLPFAAVAVDAAALAELPNARGAAVMASLAQTLGGHVYPFSQHRFQKFFGRLHDQPGKQATYGRVTFQRRSRHWWLYPEPGRAPQAKPLTVAALETGCLWAGYHISFDRKHFAILQGAVRAGELRVASLGQKGMQQLSRSGPAAALVQNLERWLQLEIASERLPKRVLYALPAVWYGGRVLDVLGPAKGVDCRLSGRYTTARYCPNRSATESGLWLESCSSAACVIKE